MSAPEAAPELAALSAVREARRLLEEKLREVDQLHARLHERTAALERATIATQAAQIAPFTWYVERDFFETDALNALLHGVEPGEVDGTLGAYLRRVHAEDQEALGGRIARLLQGREESFSFDYRSVGAQDRVRWLRCSGRLLRDAGPLRAIGATQDVTLEVEFQRVLEQQRHDLERANAELDDFTYVASHDLKEPLRGIHNYARFLAEDYGEKLDGEGRTMLEALSKQAERMQRLIDDLLGIARLGREPMQQAEADLDALLAEMLASLDFTLKERKAELRLHPLGRAVCDRVRVAELFRNLVTNALKYNDKPSPVIEIGRDGDHGCYVRDNGIGIATQHRQRVFAPFKRLHAQNAYGGGSGVGLAIVKRIVEAHSGTIVIEDSPLGGVAFHFTLPGMRP